MDVKINKPTTFWVDKPYLPKFLLGHRKDGDARTFLEAPTWDCNWYWGFGYLRNCDGYFHLHNFQQPQNVHGVKRNINMRDALLEDYDLNERIKNDLWTFCELVETVYTLREAAEVYNRGGSHYAVNPCVNSIKNAEEYRRINWEVLPSIFDTIYNLFVKTND